jgi:hypothetical protein
MEEVIDNNNKIILLLLEEEEEEDNSHNLLLVTSKKRNSISKLFKTREDEGFFEVLIKVHLSDSKLKFREFFRLNFNQFTFIL